ncbi:MAG: DUF3179 domain-containing (seleno)protein [Actinomycetota bacterium]
MRVGAAVLALALVAGACTNGDESSDGSGLDGEATPAPAIDVAAIATGEVIDYGPPPEYPDDPWSDETGALLGTIVASLTNGLTPSEELEAVAATGDPRLIWALADLLRFSGGTTGTELTNAILALADIDVEPGRPWNSVVNHMIAWDIPVPPGYFTFKRDLYGRLDPRWGELFTDANTIDWRHVSWGGVFIDDRPEGSTDPCNCIPALDDPPVTPAGDGDWYPDERIVFGVVIDGEARAYPKNIMEVHEMVNDTLGGRRIAIPYCTLCGAAQAYYTDELGDDFEQPVMRTSGLLLRSNKMMYDLSSQSFVDTFVGDATAGPLLEAGVQFEQVSVVTSTWADWKDAHPDTTIVAEDGGRGRVYPLDPLRGRDDDGPIFPIGDVDPRLPVQEPVLGLIGDDGDAVAVHVASAVMLLDAGEEVTVEGFRIRRDGSGIRADRADGSDAGGHQAFWFAWSQFRPRTALWPHDFVSDS